MQPISIVIYVSVVANISFFLVDVKRARYDENKAVMV